MYIRKSEVYLTMDCINKEKFNVQCRITEMKQSIKTSQYGRYIEALEKRYNELDDFYIKLVYEYTKHK